MISTFTIKHGWGVNDWHISGVTASTILGAMISSLCTGSIMHYGKWKLFFYTNFLLILSSGLSLVDNISLQMICRFFYGISAGAFTVLVPKFIMETAPTELKGSYGALSQIAVTLGIFVTALLGFQTK